MKLNEVLYTAEVTSVGGRDGRSNSADGKVDFKLSPPKEMGGNGLGLNPEQLFAAGYSACFLGAMKFVAGKKKLNLSADTAVTAKVGIGPIPQGFGLQVALDVNVPGLAQADAEALVEEAHQVCPYSNATRNNIEVAFSVTVA